jgi:hypothetical protein
MQKKGFLGIRREMQGVHEGAKSVVHKGNNKIDRRKEEAKNWGDHGRQD